MSKPEHISARLTARRKEDAVLLVEIAGDWLDRAGLPDVSAVEKELAGSGARALEFEAQGLGRWDSALMARISDTIFARNPSFAMNTTAQSPGPISNDYSLDLTLTERKDARRL
jgi:hypothetical protein